MLATFHSPRLVLLDDPFDDIDPLGVDATLEVVHRAPEPGAAVLESTHPRAAPGWGTPPTSRPARRSPASFQRSPRRDPQLGLTGRRGDVLEVPVVVPQ